MQRPARAYTLFAVFAVAVIALAWAGRDRIPAAVPGSRAPAFAAQTLEGETVALSDYRGKVVLVNVWATWCAPCREEMPSMERLYREFGDDGFEILAVSVDAAPGEGLGAGRPGATRSEIGRFARDLGLTFPVLHDPEQRIQRVYQTTGVPESFLLDREGRIVKRVAGATEWDHPTYRDLIQRLLES